MPPRMRRTSRKERRFEVAAACCLTAALSSALSCSPTGLGPLEGGAAAAGFRYRAGVDIVVVGYASYFRCVSTHGRAQFTDGGAVTSNRNLLQSTDRFSSRTIGSEHESSCIPTSCRNSKVVVVEMYVRPRR